MTTAIFINITIFLFLNVGPLVELINVAMLEDFLCSMLAIGKNSNISGHGKLRVKKLRVSGKHTLKGPSTLYRTDCGV